MIWAIQFLGDHGFMLLGGGTAFLSAGTVALAAQHSPTHRQRLGELTALCTLLWIIAACVPLPRWRMPGPQVHAAITQTIPAGLSPEQLPPSTPVAPLFTSSVSHVNLDSSTEIERTRGPSVAFRPTPTTFTTKPAIYASRINFGNLFASIYLIGLAMFAGWLALGHVLLWRLVRRSTQPEPWLENVFRAIMIEIGVSKTRLLICHRRTRPFSFGLLRPGIVLDLETATTQCAARLRQIFRHELVHLRRRDAWGNALFNLAMPAIYFHPLYWWLRSRSFLARELIADDQAAAADRVGYASDLLALACSRRLGKPGPLAAVGMFHFTNNLSRRIVMLTQSHVSYASKCSNRWRFSWLAASAAALSIMCANFGVRWAPAQSVNDQTQYEKKRSASDDESAARSRLGEFEKQSQDATAAKREADFQQLVATRLQLEAQLKSTQDELSAFQQQLRNLRSARHENLDTGAKPADEHQVKGLEIALAVAETQLDKDRLELERNKELFDKKAISKIALDEAEFTVKMDSLKVQQAHEDLSRVRDEMAARSHATSSATADSRHAPSSEPMVRGELDLVSLANSYANALGEVRLARAKVPTSATDKAEEENALSKYEMLRRIAAVALKHAQDELNRTQAGVKQGVVSSSELAPVAARVQILESILQTSADTPAKQ